MPSEIAIPFRVGSDGRVVTTSNPDAQIRQHVFALVNTSPTERVTVPGYGMALESLLFENMDAEEVEVQVRTMVKQAFNRHEPGVELISVKPDSDSGDNMAAVAVNYARRDASDSGTAANTNTAIIGSNGVVREVVRG